MYARSVSFLYYDTYDLVNPNKYKIKYKKNLMGTFKYAELFRFVIPMKPAKQKNVIM